MTRAGYEGLTDSEASVLDTLVRLGASSRDFLASRVGLSNAELTETLTRLEALGYAVVSKDDGGTYRAVAQIGG